MVLSNNLIVCKQVQETVHHIFNSWFWSAPVIRKRQKGTLQKDEAQKMRDQRKMWTSYNFNCDGLRLIYAWNNFHEKLWVHQCILTLGLVFYGCHRKEGRRGDVLHEAAIHEDIWTTERKGEKGRKKTTTTDQRSSDRLHREPYVLLMERLQIFYCERVHYI